MLAQRLRRLGIAPQRHKGTKGPRTILGAAGMKLKKLTFTPNPALKGLEAIRQMDSMVEIGTGQEAVFSISEFWKKYDAGEFK